jgi:hypothetical protein
MKVLLDNGADINAKDHNGYTPLLVAASNDQVEVVNWLLDDERDAKADVNEKDSDGQTALHLAVLNEDVEIVKVLIDNGATIDELSPPPVVSEEDYFDR